MSEDEAEKILLKLHLCHHSAKAEIKDLIEAGVSRHRILALYPFDFEEYADYLDRWLANVPGAALKYKDLALPVGVLLWKPQDRQDSWLRYYDGPSGQRHLDIARTHFPVDKSAFTFGLFLHDMQDALWLLAHWGEALEKCADGLDRNQLTTYVRTWTNVLQDQRTYLATLQLELNAKPKRKPTTYTATWKSELTGIYG